MAFRIQKDISVDTIDIPTKKKFLLDQNETFGEGTGMNVAITKIGKMVFLEYEGIEGTIQNDTTPLFDLDQDILPSFLLFLPIIVFDVNNETEGGGMAWVGQCGGMGLLPSPGAPIFNEGNEALIPPGSIQWTSAISFPFSI